MQSLKLWLFTQKGVLITDFTPLKNVAGWGLCWDEISELEELIRQLLRSSAFFYKIIKLLGLT
jgi:hypothetical protein